MNFFVVFFILLSLTFPSICNTLTRRLGKNLAWRKSIYRNWILWDGKLLGFYMGFLHGIIGVGFGMLVGHVTCSAMGRVLLKTKVQFLCKLLQFSI